MPLEQSSSKAALSHNIAAEINAGKPPAQAKAIAYDVQRRNDSIQDNPIDRAIALLEASQSPIDKAIELAEKLCAAKDDCAIIADADFKESDHPRGEDGKFGSGGGMTAKYEKNEGEKEYIDEDGNVRAGGLTQEQRKVEQHFYDAMKKDLPGLVAEYRKRAGNKVDPDLVKSLSASYATDNNLAGAVHEPSSKMAKIIYSQLLDEKAKNGDTSPTIFTAGGSGSGKSATMPVAMASLGAKKDGLIYDSVLSNFKSATSRIDEALEKTQGNVGIVYTNAPIEKAFSNNAKRDRSVTLDTLLNAHIGASDNIRKLIEHYADNPRVEFRSMNNAGSITDVSMGEIEHVHKYDKEQIKSIIEAKAKEMLENKEISEAEYNHLLS